jgi:hypothetical protein
MRTDTIIRTEGTQALMKNLGLVEAERFIMLIQKDSFDYTRWQENLFEDMSIEEISQKAVEFRKKTKFTTPQRTTPTKRVSLRKKKEFA